MLNFFLFKKSNVFLIWNTPFSFVICALVCASLDKFVVHHIIIITNTVIITTRTANRLVSQHPIGNAQPKKTSTFMATFVELSNPLHCE